MHSANLLAAYCLPLSSVGRRHSNACPGAASTGAERVRANHLRHAGPARTHADGGETISRTHSVFASFLFLLMSAHAGAQRDPTYLQNTYKERTRGQDLCSPRCPRGASSASKQQRLKHQCF